MVEKEHLNEDPFSDSAGVPWEGRHFESNDWSNDDGSADQELLKTIAALKSAAATAEDVLEAIRGTRVLIPLLANLGESETGANGLKSDKSAELSIVTVETPDLQSGLPVFSSVDAMKLWNAGARPVPVEISKAALAAAKEQNTRMILDPASASEFVFRRNSIEALATGKTWTHPARDTQVLKAFETVTEPLAEILDFQIVDGDPKCELESAELTLILKLRAGLDREQIDGLMKSLADAISQSFEIGEKVDSLRVKLANADED